MTECYTPRNQLDYDRAVGGPTCSTAYTVTAETWRRSRATCAEVVELADRVYLLDGWDDGDGGDEVTWEELADVNEADTMAEIAQIAQIGVGATAVIGQCDRLTRIR